MSKKTISDDSSPTDDLDPLEEELLSSNASNIFDDLDSDPSDAEPLPFKEIDLPVDSAHDISDSSFDIDNNLSESDPFTSDTEEPALDTAYNLDDEGANLDKQEHNSNVDLPLSNASEDNDGPKLSKVAFPDISPSSSKTQLRDNLFDNVSVELSVEMGQSLLSLKEVSELSEGSIIELNSIIGDPLNLILNGQIIAEGEIIAIDNKYGLRVKKIISTES